MVAVVRSSVAPEASTSGIYPRRAFLTGLVFLLALILLTYICLRWLPIPASAPADTAPGEFSAERALIHIKTIAQNPHPSGSREQELVRDYLLQQLTSLGLESQLQTTPTIKNIIGRMAGTDGRKALMLAAHYDTVARSPGANDDSASVAAILETVRALKAGPQLKNDLIILFTDGEERGLLGAKVFSNEHEWAKNVALVFNFEARGSSGASLMFETSMPNGFLIREFARSAPYPVANSLMAELYRSLPNDTDFTVFRGAGMKGLNFAYIDGYEHYHRLSDNAENIDGQSLQHHGSYGLALSRHFGNLDLEAPDQTNVVYFNLGPLLVHYSARWALPFSCLTGLAFFVIVFLGFRKKHLTWAGVVTGWAAILIDIFVTAGIVFLITRLAGSPDSRPVTGNIELSRNLYIISCLAIGLAVFSATSALFERFGKKENLACGGLLWWLILMIVAVAFLPFGSYIFTWPLLFGLAGFAVILFQRSSDEFTIIKPLALLLCALPIFLILVPTIHTIFVAFTLLGAPLAMVTVAISLALIIPHFSIVSHGKRWLLPTAFATTGIILISAVSIWRP